MFVGWPFTIVVYVPMALDLIFRKGIFNVLLWSFFSLIYFLLPSSLFPPFPSSLSLFLSSLPFLFLFPLSSLPICSSFLPTLPFSLLFPPLFVPYCFPLSSSLSPALNQ